MTDWNYCAIAQEQKPDGSIKLVMLHGYPETRQVVKAHDIKEIVDLEPSKVEITELEVVS